MDALAKIIQHETDVESRSIVLGHLQRGGRPTLKDRVVGSRMGNYAAHLLMEGKGNRVVTIQRDIVTDMDINEALEMTKTIDKDLYRIVTLQVKELCRRAKEELNITLKVTDSVKKYLVEKGSDKKFGARPIKRAIQTYLEDLVAQSVLTGVISGGECVEARLTTKNKEKKIVLVQEGKKKGKE